MATTTNPYKRFQALLGGVSRQIALVSVVFNDGTCLVEVRGNRFVVRGKDVVPGNNVWVVNGEVVSEAPSLPVYSVKV